MWHKEKNRNPIVSLALLLALASTPMMTSLFKSDYALAQSPTETPSFPLPTVVPNDAKIRIDGSASMTRANEALKERFEKKYSGTNVELATNGTKEALKALQDGKIDIAAIGRGLTPEEEQLGLKQQRLRREKIAIIVGKDNPYKGDLKNDKFTQIYRGEITNWSQLGGPNKKIRVIDRPDSSDTREAFRNYPLFAGNLDTGSTATKLDSDDPAQVVKELGDDGIGFVLANQVSKLDNVRILSMHKTLPDDPRYPYSQPLVYVFKENPSEAVKSFVGYATAKPGQEAIETAREAEAAAVAATVARAVGEGPEGEDAAATATATPATTEAATADEKAAGTETEKAATADGEAAGTGNKTATDGNNTDGVGAATNTSATDNPGALIQPGNSAGVAAEAGEGTIPWWWILLPVAVLGALAFWWLLGRRKSQEEDTVARGVLPKDSPPPFTPTSTTGPVKEPVANTPVEPSAGINTAPLETPPNTTPGINAAGIAAGAAGLGLGAAALAGKDKDSTSENDDTPLNENSPELPLDEPNPGINTAQVETPPNTTPGINTAGIAAGIAGLGLGAAALAGRDKDNTSENSPELRLNAPDVELPNVSGRDLNVDVPDVELPSVSGKGLDVDAPDLQQPDISSTGLDDVETPDWQQPDIPDTSLDLEAPAAVVNNSHHSLPRISTSIEAETPPATEHEVSDSQPEENNPSTQEELPSASTNNWLGNFAAGAGAVAAAGAGAAALGAEKIKSKLAGKDASESTEDEQVDSESLEINGTVPYPQLPDVWDTEKEEATNQEESSSLGDALNRDNIDLEQPPQMSPTDLWGTSQTEEATNQEQQQTSYLEQPPQTSPTDLWGTSQTEEATNQEQQQTQPTEQPNNQEEEEEEEKSSFSLGGIAAGAAAGLAGAAAIGSSLLNRDGDTSDDSENAEENNSVEQEPVAENQDTQNSRGGLGTGWFLNRFRGNTQDATDDTQTSEIPEVSITNENEQLAGTQPPPQEQTNTDGLPNVWVSQSNPQTTTEETVSEEEIAQFGATSTSENDSANDSSSVGGAALAAGAGIGAFALGSQMLGNDEENSEDAQNSPSESSLGENEALDQIANQAEIDTAIRTPEQKRDPGDTDWDRIYGIHHNGATAVPGESNILLANRTPKWAYASWNIAPADREAMQNQGANQLVLRLYDVTNLDLSYQSPKLVQQYECEETVSHRYVAIPNTDRDYITEIGYLTKDKDWLLVSRSPIVRVFSRPHKDFWFEADAELIIHGATEPGATVTIDGQNIKVKQDGTFHLRVPFTESLINYLITAVAPDSEQAKTIHMQFSQQERKNS